ncbi:DNA repair protein RecN [Longirhabdus pacifica]|uniref:DNA repair protein RecN n=1 Tax=Longirhabdus pacifica TaxID=2305227 RepID=UPI001008B23C|nr:DNA repair protein RecN [Longirhabdus pacifica]
MLVECTIRNLAVIESLRVQFFNGFHVITGETGAGKSMVIDALSLIAGGRASTDLIRFGSDKAEIECLFQMPLSHAVWDQLEESGLQRDQQEQLIIRRTITSNGKSMCRVNGQLVNLTTLKKVGQHLINIHGQHEHQSLFDVEKHLHWLDQFAGEDFTLSKRNYALLYRSYHQNVKKLQSIQEDSQRMLQMMDLYRFQIEEIENAQLIEDEEECLKEERQKLGNAEKLMNGISTAYHKVQNDSMDAVQTVLFELEQLVDVDKSGLDAIYEQIKSISYMLEDASMSLRDYQHHIVHDPERLNEVESRLNLIHTLQKKYGSSISEVLTYYNKIKAEFQDMEHKDEQLESLENEIQKQKEELLYKANELTHSRKMVANELAQKVMAHLEDLHMGKTKFEVHMVSSEQHLNENGQDQIQFLISANPGEPLRPLQKIASGGEISRIMLAMKTAFSSIDQVPVLIFDEVDTGVSGRAAQAIADKLSALSTQFQVFSITHLPQVACMADQHYLIQKQIQEQRTFTNVEHLRQNGKITELARMLGGVEVTATTEEHAREMLELAEEKKQSRNHLQV